MSERASRASETVRVSTAGELKHKISLSRSRGRESRVEVVGSRAWRWRARSCWIYHERPEARANYDTLRKVRGSRKLRKQLEAGGADAQKMLTAKKHGQAVCDNDRSAHRHAACPSDATYTRMFNTRKSETRNEDILIELMEDNDSK